jgi:outer membrane biosynthesis protein TonB
MHSFHPSRGRILFEVLCALTISASCVVAWQQSFVSAFLAMAGVTALYALVHLTDLRRPKLAAQAATPDFEPAAAPEPEPVDDEQGDLLAYEPTVVELVVEEQPAPAPKPKRRPRKKPAAAKVVQAPAPDPEPAPEPVEIEEEYHAPVTPLFEPQPIVRQQRAVFGRKAG